MRFVGDGKLPLLVLESNTADNEDFELNNRQIQPNTIVRRIMLKVLAE